MLSIYVVTFLPWNIFHRLVCFERTGKIPEACHRSGSTSCTRGGSRCYCSPRSPPRSSACTRCTSPGLTCGSWRNRPSHLWRRIFHQVSSCIRDTWSILCGRPCQTRCSHPLSAPFCSDHKTLKEKTRVSLQAFILRVKSDHVLLHVTKNPEDKEQAKSGDILSFLMFFW